MNRQRFDERTRTQTLIGSQDDALCGVVANATSALAATNIFNPSLATVGDNLLVAIRGEAFPGERPFHSWLIESRPSGQLINIVDLTALAREYGLAVVADPKLVRLGDEVYATFNNGYTATGPNSIYLQRVFPTVGPPQECRLPERQRIEKNWAFFVDRRGDLCALYGVAPVLLLALRSGCLGADAPLDFARLHFDGRPELSSRYTIGTQMNAASDGEMQFVVHEKHRVMHKRAYTGRLARISLERNPTLRLSSTRLIHSYTALLPQLRPHNRRLISATYFSGISSQAGDLLMSYGINDKAFGIARVQEAAVWTMEGAER